MTGEFRKGGGKKNQLLQSLHPMTFHLYRDDASRENVMIS